VKGATIVFWLAMLVAAYVWFHRSGIPLRHLPAFVRGVIARFGVWGPLLLLVFFLLRTSLFFFVPTTALTFVAGSLYGPVWGTLLNILGDNLSASIGFGLGRLLGRRVVKENERGWIKKYDTLLQEEGFYAVLFMRLLFFPFDPVNYGCGMTGMLYRQYAFATLLGTLPAIITFTILGNSFENPHALLIFLILFVLTVISVLLIRRSSWVKRRLFPAHPPIEHVI
jgi:uncharacterized membrane protein YdjX (TVP38/TMEM64 family)